MTAQEKKPGLMLRAKARIQASISRGQLSLVASVPSGKKICRKVSRKLDLEPHESHVPTCLHKNKAISLRRD